LTEYYEGGHINEWRGHVARIGEMESAYSVLVGKPEGKRLLGRHRRRWKYNIVTDLREMGWEDVHWMDLP
jgi:hypothetical protein